MPENQELELSAEAPVYEPPILLDLEEVVSGCGVCITGGGGDPK